MATRKEVKNRISSVKERAEDHGAMEMVAAARLRRAEQRIDAAAPLLPRELRQLRKMTRQVRRGRGAGGEESSVLQERDEEKNVGVLLVTGDRGPRRLFQLADSSRRCPSFSAS